MFFLPMSFLKIMYSQNAERDVLEVLEIQIFFTAHSGLADLDKFFKTFFPWNLQFGGDISVSFLKIKTN